MTDEPQTGDPLIGDSPGFLDLVAEEASAESQANLTEAGAAQDVRGEEIDPRAGLGGGAG